MISFWGLLLAGGMLLVTVFVVVGVGFALILSGQRRYLKEGGRALAAQREALSGQFQTTFMGNPMLTGSWSDYRFTAQFHNNDGSGPVSGRGLLCLKVSGLRCPLRVHITPRAPLARIGGAVMGMTLVKTDDTNRSVLTSHPEVMQRVLADPDVIPHLRTLLGHPTGNLQLSTTEATLYYSAPSPAAVQLSTLLDALHTVVHAISHAAQT